MTKQVAVLMGGSSSERQVSLWSGEACARNLELAGFRVSRIDVDKNLPAVLAALKPDVAFNALHGVGGEDGTVQGLLEVMQIPYTHSGVLASSLAMNKQMAKTMMALAGVPVAEGVLLPAKQAFATAPLPRPFVMKPNSGGSSVGVFIVKENAPMPALPDDFKDTEMLCEEFVDGLELTCAVLDGKALGVIEIVANTEFYDYEAKYAKGGSNHILPARISPNIYSIIEELSVKAHHALGCRGVSRADFRYDPKRDKLVCLEVNTQPGMTATSLVPELAAFKGISFVELVTWLIKDSSLNR